MPSLVGSEMCIRDRDRTHYNLTPAQKQVDGYQQVFTSAAIMHFGAGVRPDIGKVILAHATPPATIEDMLAAAEAVEAEQAKKGTPGASALAIAEPVTAEATSNESASASSFDFGQLQTQTTLASTIIDITLSDKLAVSVTDWTVVKGENFTDHNDICLLYTSPSPRD